MSTDRYAERNKALNRQNEELSDAINIYKRQIMTQEEELQLLRDKNRKLSLTVSAIRLVAEAAQ